MIFRPHAEERARLSCFNKSALERAHLEAWGGDGLASLALRDASQSSLRRLRKLVCAAASAAMLLSMRPPE
jgi:hypothetical protein